MGTAVITADQRDSWEQNGDFILHDWDPAFGPFSRDERLVAVLGELLGPAMAK